MYTNDRRRKVQKKAVASKRHKEATKMKFLLKWRESTSDRLLKSDLSAQSVYTDIKYVLKRHFKLWKTRMNAGANFRHDFRVATNFGDHLLLNRSFKRWTFNTQKLMLLNDWLGNINFFITDGFTAQKSISQKIIKFGYWKDLVRGRMDREIDREVAINHIWRKSLFKVFSTWSKNLLVQTRNRKLVESFRNKCNRKALVFLSVI